MKPTVNCLTTQDSYRTPDRAGSWIGRSSPNTVFYAKTFMIVFHAARLARKGLYDNERWVDSSITTVMMTAEVRHQMHTALMTNGSR